jgi:hypothetical protein
MCFVFGGVPLFRTAMFVQNQVAQFVGGIESASLRGLKGIQENVLVISPTRERIHCAILLLASTVFRLALCSMKARQENFAKTYLIQPQWSLSAALRSIKHTKARELGEAF